MDIELIRFHSFYTATTNPPINRDRSLQLKKEYGDQVFLEDERYENGRLFRQRFSVTQEQFRQIVSLFESLNIREALFDKLCAPAPPPLPPMAGGSSGSSFTVCANGVSVTAGDFTCDGASRLSAALEGLKKECGDPILDIHPSEDAPFPGFAPGAPAPIGLDMQAAKPPAQTATTADGRTCPGCGSAVGASAFCPECGMPLGTFSDPDN